MKIARFALLLVGVFLLMLMSNQAKAASIVLIVNGDVVESSLDEATVTKIFQGKMTRWSNQLKIVPVMLKDGSTHENFVEDIIGSTTSRFTTYWKQAVFSGRGIPPKSFESELDLVKYVASTPGAIGYVSPLTPVADVKEVTLDQ
jgi:ABC-type phosphate transport system substrate-binding protein